MTVWIRIALYVLAGFAYGRGWIGDEVRDIITTDPEMVIWVERAIFAAILLIPASWWRAAKRFGWPT